MNEMISKRAGKSNVRQFGGQLAATCLEFYPGYPGVLERDIAFNKSLTSTVSSYRGKKDPNGVYNTRLDTPGSMIRANLEANQKPRYDYGHPFSVRKEEFYASSRRTTLRGRSNSFYLGPLWLTGPVPAEFQRWRSSELTSVGPSQIDLSKGVKAIAETEPSKSDFSLVRAIAEAVTQFPSVPFWESHKSVRRGEFIGPFGAEYLNIVFGVAPTVQDIYALCQRVITFGDRLQQIERSVGRPVRRRYDFPESSSSKSGKTESLGPDNVVVGPKIPNYFWKNEPVFTSHTETITEKYWFAGAFEYYLSPLLEKLGPAGDFYAKADHILGLKLDLATIWELTPWSWLADWFFNVGDLITINEKLANDSLVIRYGYLMRTTRMVYTAATSDLVSFEPSQPTTVSSTTRITVKERVRSTPYGFGTTGAALSGQQWAILVALGLTNGERTFN